MNPLLRLVGRLSFLILFMVSGCIQSISPDNTETIMVTDSQLFSATADGDLVWILDGKEVGRGESYLYTVDATHFGNHQLIVKEEGGQNDSREWTISDVMPETCNGIDDDNNGLVDDNIQSIPITCGVGACEASGERICVNGQLVDVCEPGEPVEEVCWDGLDNDCDGDRDEECEIVVTVKIPDTGQTTSYTDTFGEDSDYMINPQSYTLLDANGDDNPVMVTKWAMIRDNVTGLIWENKTDDGSIHDKDTTCTWYDPDPSTNGGNAGTQGSGMDTKAFIDELNAANFGGYSDWRLPTAKELSWIANANRIDPAVNTAYFENTMSYHYWSSTTSARKPQSAWTVFFATGDVGYYGKSELLNVRAVRGDE